MQYSNYIGHVSQLSGIEEHRLIGGKGDGMRLLEVRNGLGLECTISADRCADISRMSFMGLNVGYFSPCGYVAPQYYDKEGTNWLNSFTAGFLTTCGLNAVGSPCVDEGEALPLHGTIANTPAVHVWWRRESDALVVDADMCDSGIFGRKLTMHRKLEFSTVENRLRITDTVENHGETSTPIMILYHMNMGYPLLSEKAELFIPSVRVTPRDEHAANGLGTLMQIFPPTEGYIEQCFFHEFEKEGRAMIFNPDIGIGLEITFDTTLLNTLCQWKMFGKHDYVLGLEPGNCTPAGRDVMRREGKLQFLASGDKTEFSVDVQFFSDKQEWEAHKAK